MNHSIYKTFQGVQPTPFNFDNRMDAFNRLKISQPLTLFDSTNKYALSNVFFSNTVSGGFVSTLTQESTANLITHTNPSSVLRQSKYAFPYQPGKSLLVLNSFCFSNVSSTIQRIGYFDDSNGIFLELSDSLYICKRNNGSDIKVPQSQWENPLYNLSVYNVQIFWIDIEWLGVGTVRTGFIIDGIPVLCHNFHHANYINSVYMRTACLPIRASIQNTAQLTSNAWMKSICSTVISEGGYDPKSQFLFIQHVGLSAASTIAIGNGVPTPIISLRLASGYYNMCVYIKKIILLLATNNDTAYWYLVLNPTLTTPTWVSHSVSYAVQVDTSSTSYTGGRILLSGIFSTQTNIDSDLLNSIQIGLTDVNTSDVLTLGVASLSGGTSKISAQIGWFEI